GGLRAEGPLNVRAVDDDLLAREAPELAGLVGCAVRLEGGHGLPAVDAAPVVLRQVLAVQATPEHDALPGLRDALAGGEDGLERLVDRAGVGVAALDRVDPHGALHAAMPHVHTLTGVPLLDRDDRPAVVA